MIYEDMFDTHVAEFGCIQHPQFPFLGASPDGINDAPHNPRYGRMIEIKNPTTRIVDGRPLDKYWVQMQLQMACCQLTETDFFETSFREYCNECDFLSDGETVNRTSNNSYKGTKLFFVNKIDGRAKFEYMPLHIASRTAFDAWIDLTLQEYSAEDCPWMFIRIIFWFLNQVSCVLILRNDCWFHDNIAYMQSFWDVVQRERVSGEWKTTRAKRVPKSGKGSSAAAAAASAASTKTPTILDLLAATKTSSAES